MVEEVTLTHKLREMFTDIIEEANTKKLDEYFDSNYVQTINGIKRPIDAFKFSLENREEVDEVCIIDGKYVENGNNVGSMHQLLIKKNNDVWDNMKANVIAIYKFNEHGKIISSDEVFKFDKVQERPYEEEDEEDEDESEYNGVVQEIKLNFLDKNVGI